MGVFNKIFAAFAAKGGKPDQLMPASPAASIRSGGRSVKWRPAAAPAEPVNEVSLA